MSLCRADYIGRVEKAATPVAALLGTVALTATLVPALRAAHADAVRALRAE